MNALGAFMLIFPIVGALVAVGYAEGWRVAFLLLAVCAVFLVWVLVGMNLFFTGKVWP